MRIIYHEFDLTAWGYVVADTDVPRDFDGIDQEDLRPLKLQGIEDTLSMPVHVIDFEATNMDYAFQQDASPDEIRTMCREIMCGEHPDWYVGTLRIAEAGRVILTCYNHKDRDIFVIIELHSETHCARFKVSIPRRDHGEKYGFVALEAKIPLRRKCKKYRTSEYLFALMPKEVRVTEAIDGATVRVIRFLPNENAQNSHPRAIAAEYADL